MNECDKESEWRVAAMLVTSGVIEITVISMNVGHHLVAGYRIQ